MVPDERFDLLINPDLSDPPRYHCRPVERDYFHGKHMAAFDHACVAGPLGAIGPRPVPEYWNAMKG